MIPWQVPQNIFFKKYSELVPLFSTLGPCEGKDVSSISSIHCGMAEESQVKSGNVHSTANPHVSSIAVSSFSYNFS